VIEAIGGADAVAKLESRKVDAVLLDVRGSKRLTDERR
jgi:hypothetical protein